MTKPVPMNKSLTGRQTNLRQRKRGRMLQRDTEKNPLAALSLTDSPGVTGHRQPPRSLISAWLWPPHPELLSPPGAALLKLADNWPSAQRSPGIRLTYRGDIRQKSPGERHLSFISLSRGYNWLPTSDNKNKDDFLQLPLSSRLRYFFKGLITYS